MRTARRAPTGGRDHEATYQARVASAVQTVARRHCACGPHLGCLINPESGGVQLFGRVTFPAHPLSRPHLRWSGGSIWASGVLSLHARARPYPPARRHATAWRAPCPRRTPQASQARPPRRARRASRAGGRARARRAAPRCRPRRGRCRWRRGRRALADTRRCLWQVRAPRAACAASGQAALLCVWAHVENCLRLRALAALRLSHGLGFGPMTRASRLRARGGRLLPRPNGATAPEWAPDPPGVETSPDARVSKTHVGYRSRADGDGLRPVALEIRRSTPPSRWLPRRGAKPALPLF